jgi:L-lactate dehydrogenase complex protein LldG
MHEVREPIVTSDSTTGTDTNLTESFSRMAQLLGADVVTTELPKLTVTVRESLLPDAGPIAVSADLAAFLPEFKALDSRGDREWHTAITRARLGVAATGSVLVAEADESDRLLPILASRHIVLLPAESIVRSLADAVPTLRALLTGGTRFCTFVSGPSRTADIEKILTIGAHGPRQLLIVLVDGWYPRDARTIS